MARPKLDDPTVPIAFRMKRSASEWWTERAKKEGTTLPKLIRRVLEEKAQLSQLADTPQPVSPFVADLYREHAEPNFKKGAKK
jgi:hypothetical protein